MKSADDFARMFKLHSCIGNKKFESQVKQIQQDARNMNVELSDEELISAAYATRELANRRLEQYVETGNEANRADAINLRTLSDKFCSAAEGKKNENKRPPQK